LGILLFLIEPLIFAAMACPYTGQATSNPTDLSEVARIKQKNGAVASLGTRWRAIAALFAHHIQAQSQIQRSHEAGSITPI